MILKKFSLEKAKKNKRKTFGTNEPNELFTEPFKRKIRLNGDFLKRNRKPAG